MSEFAVWVSVQHRLQSIGWRLEAQGLSRTLIEPQSNRVQTRAIFGQEAALPQQARARLASKQTVAIVRLMRAGSGFARLGHRQAQREPRPVVLPVTPSPMELRNG
jgi:hypothetical protein